MPQFTTPFVRHSCLCLFLLLASATYGEVSSEEVTSAAIELHLTPHALVVAGITSTTETDGILQRIADAEAERNALNQAKSGVTNAGNEFADIAAKLRADPDNAELMNAYQAAITAFENAGNALQVAREALLDAALDGVEASVVESLAVWRSSEGYDVPPRYRAAERSSHEWKALESALRAKHRAQRMGEQLDAHHDNLLSQVENELDVVEAQYRLTTSLDSIQQVFEQFNPS